MDVHAHSHSGTEQFEIADVRSSKYCSIGWMDSDLRHTSFLIASLAECGVCFSHFKVRSNIKDLNQTVLETSYKGIFGLVDVY